MICLCFCGSATLAGLARVVRMLQLPSSSTMVSDGPALIWDTGGVAALTWGTQNSIPSGGETCGVENEGVGWGE